MIQLEDKLYTSTEVADVLGVSLRSVYRYLEEGKLNAEIKTATGRHRFSKKNVLDFLYPDGSEQKIQPAPKPVLAEKETAPKKKVVEVVVEDVKVEEVVKAEKEVAAAEPVVVEEEPVDWLAKFREAASKYKEEAEKTKESVVEESMSMADTMRVSPENVPVADITEPKVQEAIKKHYYRSSLGGLKDIAQNIDRGSRNSLLDYAFTLNAGLSLYKPIKPFSMLHAYVKPADLAFFEKLLSLTPTDEANAQLCLILSEEANIYKTKEELHGLFVVSKDRLLADVQSLGDSVLVSEASSILK